MNAENGGHSRARKMKGKKGAIKRMGVMELNGERQEKGPIGEKDMRRQHY